MGKSKWRKVSCRTLEDLKPGDILFYRQSADVGPPVKGIVIKKGTTTEKGLTIRLLNSYKFKYILDPSQNRDLIAGSIEKADTESLWIYNMDWVCNCGNSTAFANCPMCGGPFEILDEADWVSATEGTKVWYKQPEDERVPVKALVRIATRGRMIVELQAEYRFEGLVKKANLPAGTHQSVYPDDRALYKQV